MAVTTTMVLLMDMVAAGIITFVMVHAKGGGMALMEAAKNMAAVCIAVMGEGMVKDLLQLLCRHRCRGAHMAGCITRSKGDTMAALVDC